MYYVLTESGARISNQQEYLAQESGIVVFSQDKWKQAEKLQKELHIRVQTESIHFCKVERHAQFLYGTMCIPREQPLAEGDTLSFYIVKGRIVIVTDHVELETKVTQLIEDNADTEYTTSHFLYDFFVEFLKDDILKLEQLEQTLAQIEEEVLEERAENFNGRMLQIKKKIFRYYHYYTQLTELGQELEDNELDFFDPSGLQFFDRYKDRTSRLAGETQMLREYAMQVQDVYQSEIGIRQNDIMKILTIVTTIFLPLTLIVGWYGMNFYNMPELQWKYGYLTIVALSIVVIFLTLWIFKRKKFL